MKLLLTRHGQTDWNVARKVQGITNIPLNETGIKQAQQVKQMLSSKKIDVILTSPLDRAVKTAQIIGEGRNIPVVIKDELIERAFGKLEGQKPEGIDFEEIWNYKLNKQYKDAESIGELFYRVTTFLDEIKQEYKDKTVLIVTHGGTIVPIRATLEGIPEGMEKLTGLGLDNCEIKEYEI